jgi:CheY-like chemotaxis protein
MRIRRTGIRRAWRPTSGRVSASVSCAGAGHTWRDWLFGCVAFGCACGILLVVCGRAVAQEAAEEAPAAAEETAQPAGPAGAAAPGEPAVEVPADLGAEALFADYLHFARMGAFTKADAYARALLDNADATPETLLALSEKYRNSIDTLILLVDGSTISQTAEAVLKRIREGEVLNRKNAEQITDAIGLLPGDPTQRMVGVERLQHAGEYAVPWMVEYLADPSRADLHPYIQRAMAELGRDAVNPMAVALGIDQDPVKQSLMDALGLLGYPHALPYLKRVAEDPKQTESVRETAKRAIARILSQSPDAANLRAAPAFLQLAEMYYNDVDSLRPDPRAETANVWYLREEKLVAVPVPRQIYNEVECMRCCRDALGLRPDMAESVALWVAANFRREAELGMNVQSVEPDERALADATKPADFPRSLYFARCFGPRHAQMTLMRALRDRDAAVALGAVTALDGIASAQALVGPEDVKQALTAALSFPEVRVRIVAALALARSLPPQNFPGARQVVPILASALDLRGTPTVVIVDPNADSRRFLVHLIGGERARSVAADTYTDAVNEARQELTHVDLLVLATDMRDPDVADALAQRKRDDLLALAPVVLFVKPGGMGVALRVSSEEPEVARMLAPTRFTDISDDDRAKLEASLVEAWERASRYYSRRPISDDEALRLGLEAADALRMIAMSGTSVFEFGAAEAALIRATEHPVEEMRIQAASVLAWSGTSAAQSAIAKLALAADGSDAQRITAFAILADSAKRHGTRMPVDLVDAVVKAATGEAALPIRTAASQALGAFDLGGDRAASILESVSQGG